ncbi:MAG: DUF6268 family outer membrane beta-barrel protein [Bacteroidota bacterium]
MKQFRNILILVFICLLITTNGFNQDFIDLASTGMNYVPDNKYEDADSSFSFSHQFFNIQYPHVFENKDILLGKISLNRYHSGETGFPDLYIFYLQLGMLKHLGEKSALRFAIIPKIASQLKDVDKTHFLAPCLAMVQFSPSENFTYGLGILYSKEIFGHFINPAIHAKWKINNSWLLYADFPSYGYLMYYPKKFCKAGFYASSSTTSIRLSKEFNNAYIQKSYGDFSLFADLYFTKNVVLRLKGGYSTMRSLDMYAKGETVPLTISVMEFDDNRTQLNSDIDDALFFEISLNYRYHY